MVTGKGWDIDWESAKALGSQRLSERERGGAAWLLKYRDSC